MPCLGRNGSVTFELLPSPVDLPAFWITTTLSLCRLEPLSYESKCEIPDLVVFKRIITQLENIYSPSMSFQTCMTYILLQNTKERYFAERPNNIGPHWLSLYKRKNVFENVFCIIKIWNDVRVSK